MGAWSRSVSTDSHAPEAALGSPFPDPQTGTPVRPAPGPGRYLARQTYWNSGQHPVLGGLPTIQAHGSRPPAGCSGCGVPRRGSLALVQAAASCSASYITHRLWIISGRACGIAVPMCMQAQRTRHHSVLDSDASLGWPAVLRVLGVLSQATVAWLPGGCAA